MRDAQRQLVGQLLTGDRAAEGEFLCEWGPLIKAWVRRSTSSDNVEDYSQEILIDLSEDKWSTLSAWNGLYSDEAWSPNSLKAYLRRITHRKVIDLWRADQRQLPEGGEYQEIVDEQSALGRNPEQAHSDAQEQQIIHLLIEQLPPRDKNLLHLWLQGEPDQHTARMLQMTDNNVRQRRHYLLNRLGTQFDAPRGED